MRVIIPTRGHSPRMRAHLLPLLPGTITFVVDDDSVQVPSGFDVAVAGVNRQKLGTYAIAAVREFVSKKLLEHGEWALLIDDNVGKLTRVWNEYYDLVEVNTILDRHTSHHWRMIYGHLADAGALAFELKRRCEEQGTIYGGLASEANYYFRTRKWTRVGYVKTKFAVIKNDRSLTWLGTMFEDFHMSLQVIEKYGSVAINRFARAVNPYYEAGGIGSEEDRRPHLTRDCAWLAERYEGLVRLRPGYDWQLQFATRHPSSIDKWRRSRGR